MSTQERTLYQFPISHYCEKARWSLDLKGMPYRVKNVVPGIHILVLRVVAGTRTVPVLVDGPITVTDSTDIALYLDRSYPGPALVPKEEPTRAKALELDDFFNRMAGPSVRRWIYGELMKEPGNAAAALFAAYPKPVRALGKVVAPFLERELRRMYRIKPETIELGREEMLQAAQRIEDETGGDPARYLVGGSLTLADITAASTLAAIVSPPGSPYESEPGSASAAVREMRRAMRERPAGRWVTERYRSDRPRAADAS